ncbi:MAG: hypothetical protein FGM33_06340 [Candidatus Kapabacteria bacterium]|nr:hypothetical protein [Candidatus Kapabacteria bacterium]
MFVSYRLPGQYFSFVPSSKSQLNFRNDIIESDDLNIIRDFYTFNGGGVGVGDLDSDGLLDVVFTSTHRGIRMFRNLGNMRFEDRSVASGLVINDTLVNTGVLVAELTGDGLPDVYISRRYSSNVLFVNNGDGTFRRDSTSPVVIHAYTTQAAQIDYDRDGDLDLFLVNSGEPRRQGYLNPGINDRLFRNDGGGVYVDVTAAAGIVDKGYGLSASIGDVNDDGWPDIFVGNDFEERDKLWINQRNGTFVNRATSQMPHMSWASMGSDMADLNEDGMLDILSLDMLPRSNYRRQTQLGGMSIFGPFFDSLQRVQNCYFLNRGDGQFVEVGQMAGVAATDWSWSVLAGDYDLDGDQDLYVTNGTKRDMGDQDYSYNLRSKGVSSPKEASMAMPTSPQKNFLLVNEGRLRFRSDTSDGLTAVPQVSNGAAQADLDNDGDLDIIVNNTDAEAGLFENRVNARPFSVRLKGDLSNPDGIGARVTFVTSKRRVVREVYASRGFQSTSDARLSIGLSDGEDIDSVVVLWSDGRRSVHRGFTGTGYHTIDRRAASSDVAQIAPRPLPMMSRLADSILPFVHRENAFDDFKRERLIPFRYSKDGPRMAVGDVNRDGLEDVVVCGAKHQPTQCFVQRKGGTFVSIDCGLNEAIESEDVDVALVDIDGDRDLDLYVVTGGAEFSAGDDELADVLYLNDGKGQFTRSTTFDGGRDAGSCVVPADFDGDGDVDLFVGGRIVPGKYGQPARSVLYRNDKGTLRDVTDEIAKGLSYIGMTTSAAWVDIDRDRDLDLVVVGDWMSPTIWRNTAGRFENVTSSLVPANMHGMWSCVRAADIDADGDQDLLLGNIGLNCRFVPDASNPIRCRMADVDDNGSVDHILSQGMDDRDMPIRGRFILLQHIPTLTRQYITFDSYARASVSDVLATYDTTGMSTMLVQQYASGVLLNSAGRFDFRPLPDLAQVAPIMEMLPQDFDADGDVDVLLIGNTRTADADVIGFDGGMGLVLRNDGSGQLSPLTVTESGLVTFGEARDVVTLRRVDGTRLLVVSRNSAPAHVYALPAGK